MRLDTAVQTFNSRRWYPPSTVFFFLTFDSRKPTVVSDDGTGGGHWERKTRGRKKIRCGPFEDHILLFLSSSCFSSFTNDNVIRDSPGCFVNGETFAAAPDRCAHMVARSMSTAIAIILKTCNADAKAARRRRWRRRRR